MLKLAILGNGGFAKVHARNAIRAGAEVVALCGRNKEKLAAFNQEIGGGARVYLSGEFEKMLAAEKLDALIIALPPFARQDEFVTAARQGINIFVEKPIAASLSEGQAMVKAAANSGIITMSGFHMRMSQPVKRVKGLIEDGTAGRPVLFQGAYSCNSLHNAWYIDKDRSGGQIFEQVIHLYDMNRFLLGEPKTVRALTNNICHNHLIDYTIEDVSGMIAQFTNGSLSSITANNCEIPGAWLSLFKIVYENLVAEFENESKVKITYTKDPDKLPEIIEDHEDVYQLEMNEFLDCIKNGRPATCDVNEGFKTLVYVDKVTRSAARNGEMMDLYL